MAFHPSLSVLAPSISVLLCRSGDPSRVEISSPSGYSLPIHRLFHSFLIHQLFLSFVSSRRKCVTDDSSMLPIPCPVLCRYQHHSRDSVSISVLSLASAHNFKYTCVLRWRNHKIFLGRDLFWLVRAIRSTLYSLITSRATVYCTERSDVSTNVRLITKLKLYKWGVSSSIVQGMMHPSLIKIYVGDVFPFFEKLWKMKESDIYKYNIHI